MMTLLPPHVMVSLLLMSHLMALSGIAYHVAVIPYQDELVSQVVEQIQVDHPPYASRSLYVEYMDCDPALVHATRWVHSSSMIMVYAHGYWWR